MRTRTEEFLMTARAPLTRRVDMLTGAKAPDKFVAALSEADDFIRELDTLRELQTRLAEVEAENAAVRESMTTAVGFYDCPCGSAFEFAKDSTLEEYGALNRWLGRHLDGCSDDLAERLEDSLEAHDITRGLLAATNRELGSLRAEGDTWAGKATGAS